MLIVCVLASIACVALGPFTERAFGKKDPGQCTIDEVAGQALTYLLLPLEGISAPAVVISGFLAFRVFDILKPPPARQLEKLPAGWGVLLDDLAAGLYANVLLQVLVRTGLLARAVEAFTPGG